MPFVAGTTVCKGRVARSQCIIAVASATHPRLPSPAAGSIRGDSAERNMAGSRIASAVRMNGKNSTDATQDGKKNAVRKTDTGGTMGPRDDEAVTPIAVSDALCRTARETCHQRDRRSRLPQIGAARWEVVAAEALVDTCDLALEECVREFEKQCRKEQVSDSAEVRQAASTLWLASREYIRRNSIASKASRQLSQQHDADAFSDIHLEYELEASSLLALKQAVEVYAKLRPQAR